MFISIMYSPVLLVLLHMFTYLAVKIVPLASNVFCQVFYVVMFHLAFLIFVYACCMKVVNHLIMHYQYGNFLMFINSSLNGNLLSIYLQCL